jgi:hypothetical protein
MLRAMEKDGQVGDKYIARFPPGLRDRLHELARARGISLNALIVELAEQAVDTGGTVAALRAELDETKEILRSYRNAVTGSNVFLEGMCTELLKLAPLVPESKLDGGTRYMLQMARAMLDKDGERMYDLFIAGFAKTDQERATMEADKAALMALETKAEPKRRLNIAAAKKRSR